MKLNIAAHAVYEMPQEMTALLQIEVVDSPLQKVSNESLLLNPLLASEEFRDIFGNRVRRFVAPAGVLEIDYQVDVELQAMQPADPAAAEVDVIQLPPEILLMTMPSRYCESDRLSKVALDLFGSQAPGAQRVYDICDWIRAKVQYEYGHTTSSTSAFDMVTERIGVCRDFSHLAIAFCRALNIPARYAAGYCLELEPPDFHAYFQAYLAPPPGFGNLPGWWYDFDATYARPRRGLANISVGRDAIDTSMMTFFGNANFLEQTVMVTER